MLPVILRMRATLRREIDVPRKNGTADRAGLASKRLRASLARKPLQWNAAYSSGLCSPRS